LRITVSDQEYTNEKDAKRAMAKAWREEAKRMNLQAEQEGIHRVQAGPR